MTDIDGMHPERAPVQQHIGETAGRCSYIEASQTGRIDLEDIEGMFKFQPGTGRPSERAVIEPDILGLRDFRGGFDCGDTIDRHLPRLDQMPCPAARFGQPPLYQGKIEALRCHRPVRRERVPKPGRHRARRERSSR